MYLRGGGEEGGREEGWGEVLGYMRGVGGGEVVPFQEMKVLLVGESHSGWWLCWWWCWWEWRFGVLFEVLILFF